MTTHKIIPATLFKLAVAVTVALATPAFADLIYVSSGGVGSAGDISFQDEDIVVLDTDSGAWNVYFDGSDFNIAGSADLNAFTILDNGNVLMSFDSPTTIPGVGTVADGDIVEYADSTGLFSFYFDGSDVGVGPKKENIDAIGIAADGRLVISLDSDFQVNGVEGRDEDLIAFTGTSGSSTSGSFAHYLDATDLALKNPNEDIQGVWIDPVSEDIYVTVKNRFDLGDVKGDGLDIVICEPLEFNPVSACTSPLAIYLDGSENGLSTKTIDGLFIVPAE